MTKLSGSLYILNLIKILNVFSIFIKSILQAEYEQLNWTVSEGNQSLCIITKNFFTQSLKCVPTGDFHNLNPTSPDLFLRLP